MDGGRFYALAAKYMTCILPSCPPDVFNVFVTRNYSINLVQATGRYV